MSSSRPTPQTHAAASPDTATLHRVLRDLPHVAAIGCTADGQIAYWNHGANLLLGYAEGDVVDIGLGELMRTSGQRAWCARVLAAAEPVPDMHLAALPHRDGTPISCLVQVERTDSRPPGTLLVITPATTGARPVSPAQATGDLDGLAVLAAGIAHDFNNLLLGIIGHADLLALDLPPDGEAREHADEIGKAVLRAADLCRQLQAFSGTSVTIADELDLSDLVRDTAPLASLGLGTVSLCLELADDLPRVAGDPQQIRQVLLNLITNASEAVRGRDDGATVTVRTRRRDSRQEPLHDPVRGDRLPDGTYVVLEVLDNGPGMTGEQLARAFQPFYSTKFAGRGLGLAAGLGIVRAHGGSIAICGRPEGGTSVTVALPVVATEASPSVQVPASRAANLIARQTPRMLVVDDEADVRDVTTALLTRAGYEVDAVSSGHQALDALEDDAGAYDLVLLDVMMPGIDGLQVLEHLRQWRHDLPVVVFSGHAPEATAAAIDADPYCRFLSKPYGREDLLRVVGQMLAITA